MITKTWGEGGTYSTLTSAMNSITFPPIDNITLVQVGSCEDSGSVNWSSSNWGTMSITIKGDRNFKMYRPASSSRILNGFGYNFTQFTIENLTIIGTGNQTAPLFEMLLTGGTVEDGEIYIMNNFLDFSSYTHSNLFSQGAATPNRRVKVYFYNNLLVGNNSAVIVPATNSSLVRFYLNTNTFNRIDSGASIDCVSDGYSAYLTMHNTFYNAGSSLSNAITSGSTSGSAAIQFLDTSDRTSVNYYVPIAGSRCSSGGFYSPTTTATNQNRYLNFITFTSASTKFQIGANGLPIDLDPPTNIDATNGEFSTKIRLTWTSSSNADGYYIYRTSAGSDISYFNNLTPIVNISAASTSAYDDDDLSLDPRKDYFYRIRAYKN